MKKYLIFDLFDFVKKMRFELIGLLLQNLFVMKNSNFPIHLNENLHFVKKLY